MWPYLKRLLRTGASYQAAELLAKALALVTLPLYTRHVSRAGYGTYQALFTAVVLFSIILRAGLGEAFVRLYYDRDPASRRELARTLTATVLWTTTLCAAALAPFAGPLSRELLGADQPTLFYAGLLGLWAFTNLEVAYAQLRVEERAGAYLRASLVNVALTITLTVTLVVFLGEGARGLAFGNFIATACVVVGLWAVALRGQVALRPSRQALVGMLAFGLPTLPAETLLYGLQVADRFYLLRAFSPAAAGEYSVALQLATVVFVFVRGFQYAWPPLAYSIVGERVAARLYALVTTYLALFTGIVVCAVVLLGRWLVRLFAAPSYFGAHRALPFLALAWSLYGLYMAVLVIPGRARATSRLLPVAALGLTIDLGLLFALVPASGLGLGIAGAGIALCAAYGAMVAALIALTRRLYAVPFQWSRLARLTVVLAGVAVSGELLLPTAGVVGLIERLAWLGLAVPGLLLARFFSAPERAAAARLAALLRRGSTAA